MGLLFDPLKITAWQYCGWQYYEWFIARFTCVFVALTRGLNAAVP